MLKAESGGFLSEKEISKKFGPTDLSKFKNSGSLMGKSTFDIVLPAVESPHEFVAVEDSASEDELAAGGHELGTNIDEVDVEMELS